MDLRLKKFIKQNSVVMLIVTAVLCVSLLLIFYFRFRFHVWSTYQIFADIYHPIELSLNIIAILLAVLVLMIFGLLMLMQHHALRLKNEVIVRAGIEKEREDIKLALLQSQKLEAVGMLAGGIAHNFNNILYAIQGYVQMTREDIDPETIAHQNLGKVLEAVERGQELVQGILSFSRREHYHMSPVDLHEVLQSAVQLLKSTLPASVELFVDLQLQDGFVRGNRTQLQQVFINVIRNATDSLGEKGKIIVHAAREDNLDNLKKIRIGLTSTAYFVIRITDNGAGMSEETLRHLFEPFFTTKDIGKGTGLGLATARSIVRDHRGEIVVQSALNEGSTFIILLPVVTGAEEKNNG